MKNLIIYQLLIAVILLPIVGIGWALFSLIGSTTIIGLISFKSDEGRREYKEILLACYYGIVLTTIASSPWIGLIGTSGYMIYDIAGEIYFRIKYCK